MKLLQKAKEHLILYHPLFAYLALQVEFIREDEVGTSSIDGIVFRYNEYWLQEHDYRWVGGLIAHGMGHLLLSHPLRAEGKNIALWNEACDYAVNSLLKKSKVPLINDLYNPQYNALDTEQIYELLKNEENNKGDDDGSDEDEGNGFMGFNDGSDFESDNDSDACKVALPDMTKTPEKELEAIMNQKIMDAVTQAKFCGDDLPDAVKEIIDELKEPKKNWREILYRFTAVIVRNDYDWMRPDESYLQRDIYVPGLHNEEIGDIIIALDTSASIDKELLCIFLSELKEAVSLMAEEVLEIQCDTRIRKVEKIQAEDIDKIVPEGRGGTSFIPVFEYLTNHDLKPKALIYFTDGECWDTLIEPDYPVLWCIYDNKDFNPKFGEVIFIDN